jgi:DNA-directed RNA polymerase specialized sigma24 family protein
MDMAIGSEHEMALHALINADPAEFDRRLEIVLASVKDLLRNAILRTLRSHFAAHSEPVRDNVDDLAGEAVLVLVRKLRELRTDASSEPIQNFPAYAATVASNVCYTYLRRRYPAWARLKNQVRYLATHDPELALRELRTGTPFCVLTEWDARKRPALSIASVVGAGVDAQTPLLRDLIKAIVRNAGRPVELNELISVIAELRGIRDDGPTSATMISTEALGDRLADPRPVGSPDEVSFLRQVWDEVRQLPLRQRMALLLNLRDETGRGVLALFPLTATASIRQIAEVLEMPADELARMWNDLPIDDLKIAERLGITRQQVINLRKAGRARLARRVADAKR